MISAIVFAWQKSTHIKAEVRDDDGVKTYELKGPLFFAAVTDFKELFDPAGDPEQVVVEFRGCRVYDHSALEAIHSISEKYREQGKTMKLRHLSHECQTLLEKAGDIIDVDVDADPDYHVALNKVAL